MFCTANISLTESCHDYQRKEYSHEVTARNPGGLVTSSQLISYDRQTGRQGRLVHQSKEINAGTC